VCVVVNVAQKSFLANGEMFLSDECKCTIGFDILLELKKYCTRCTTPIIKEEKYLLFKGIYCRACMDTIENDPDYEFIFKRSDIFVSKSINEFWKLKNIEVL